MKALKSRSSCSTALLRRLLPTALILGFAAAALGHGDGGIAADPSPAQETGPFSSPFASSAANVPLALSSRQGAPYTIYLDFGGFSFTGLWGNNALYSPGN